MDRRDDLPNLLACSRTLHGKAGNSRVHPCKVVHQFDFGTCSNISRTHTYRPAYRIVRNVRVLWWKPWAHFNANENKTKVPMVTSPKLGQ